MTDDAKKLIKSIDDNAVKTVNLHLPQRAMHDATINQRVPARVRNVVRALDLPEDAALEAGELVALLYAMTYPKEEWRDRYDEAKRGMRSL